MGAIRRLSMAMAIFAGLHAQAQAPAQPQEQPQASPQARPKAPVTEEVDTKPAMAAAEAWLALVDRGAGAQSWDAAASLFRTAVTPERWNEALMAARGPLGPLENRKLLSAAYTRALPGAPEGEYVVIQYQSRFANRPLATETVVPMREADGSWRVSGYLVR